MISFFIDTATSIATIALSKGTKFIDKIIIQSNSNLSNNIFKHINELFNKNNIKVDDIKRIYVTIGPGSFTGIRIGVTIAKTFAWAKNIDIIPLSSLEVMASSSTNNVIIPIIDARRGFVFGGVYNDKLDIIMEDQYINFEKLESDYSGQLIDNTENINIEKIILKHQYDKPVNPHEINPKYLKITEAEANNDRM